ncbi:aldehyde dehydrogenase family protein [Novosphingobium resinovorum]
MSAIVAMIAAHLPPGLLRAVNGGAETGEALIGAPEVAKVAFTGGGTVGRAVLEQASRRFIPSVMELGGNDPLIVLEDFAPTTARMEALVWASFLNAGQVCMAAKRLYVHEAVAEHFVDAYVETARRLLYMGDPLDPRTNIGPVISAQAQGRISRVAAQARCDGGMVVPLLNDFSDYPEQGYFVAPQLVTGLTDNAELVRDEQFGPIVPVVTWRDEADVRRWAATGDCLSASVWSSDAEQAWDLAASLLPDCASSTRTTAAASRSTCRSAARDRAASGASTATRGCSNTPCPRPCTSPRPARWQAPIRGRPDP